MKRLFLKLIARLLGMPSGGPLGDHTTGCTLEVAEMKRKVAERKAEKGCGR